MKKIIALICAITFVFTLCACDMVPTETVTTENDTSMFVEVELSAYGSVFYQKDTKVLYAYTSRSGFTMLVNPDGTPQIYKGE